MIFADKRSYGIVDSNFIGNYKYGYAYLGSFRDGNKISPSDGTALEISKELVIAKMFNEQSERSLLGAQKDVEVDAINFIDKTLNKLNRRDFAYGYNSRFGYSDTTGSASGHNSEKVIMKAVLELIEKNELLAFWYGERGYKVNCNVFTKDLVSRFGITSPTIDLFICNEVSNYYTAIAILSKHNRIKGSGVAIGSSVDVALELAIKESSLIERCFLDNPNSYFAKISEEEHVQALNHIASLKSMLPVFDYKKATEEEDRVLRISDYVGSIFFHIVNAGLGKRMLTVKCISDELFSCLPTKHRLLLSLNKAIMQDLELDSETISNKADCILL